jgi:hypothetical protein
MVLSGGFIKDEVVLIVSSDPALGASNVRNQGSSFEVQYDGEGLEIPKEAQNVTVSVQQSEVWWNIPNVVPGNDTFYITGPNSLDVPTNYVLVIPKGLYATSELDQALSRELALTDAKSTAGPLINIQGDASTDKTLLKFNYPGVSVDFLPFWKFPLLLQIRPHTTRLITLLLALTWWTKASGSTTEITKLLAKFQLWTSALAVK